MKCANCNVELNGIFDHTTDTLDNCYENALNFCLLPGYGERFDGNKLLHFYLCKDCTDTMFVVLPTLEKFIITNYLRGLNEQSS